MSWHFRSSAKGLGKGIGNEMRQFASYQYGGLPHSNATTHLAIECQRRTTFETGRGAPFSQKNELKQEFTRSENIQAGNLSGERKNRSNPMWNVV
jgi:hypothetical protein